MAVSQCLVAFLLRLRQFRHSALRVGQFADWAVGIPALSLVSQQFQGCTRKSPGVDQSRQTEFTEQGNKFR